MAHWAADGAEAAKPIAEALGAHHLAVWGLAWHPAGHLLASASQDGATKFWARNRCAAGTARHCHSGSAW